MGLLLSGEGLLLAGDRLNQTLLLLGAGGRPLSQLRQTLEGGLRLPLCLIPVSHAPTPCPRPRWGHLHHLDQLRLGGPFRPRSPPRSAEANTRNRAAGRGAAHRPGIGRRGRGVHILNPEPHAIRGMGAKTHKNSGYSPGMPLQPSSTGLRLFDLQGAWPSCRADLRRNIT